MPGGGHRLTPTTERLRTFRGAGRIKGEGYELPFGSFGCGGQAETHLAGAVACSLDTGSYWKAGGLRSRQRVVDHGEVFTSASLVGEMLDMVKVESERIDSRFLEPACGSGNFLIPVVQRKLATVRQRYGRSGFENGHYALLALMCTYGIELLKDNVEECRANLLDLFVNYLKVDRADTFARAARAVLSVNIVQGDALAMTATSGEDLVFPEWGYLGKGLFQRRDFKYENLTQASSFGEGTLFERLDKRDIFAPLRIYQPMTVREIADV